MLGRGRFGSRRVDRGAGSGGGIGGAAFIVIAGGGAGATGRGGNQGICADQSPIAKGVGKAVGIIGVAERKPGCIGIGIGISTAGMGGAGRAPGGAALLDGQ